MYILYACLVVTDMASTQDNSQSPIVAFGPTSCYHIFSEGMLDTVLTHNLKEYHKPCKRVLPALNIFCLEFWLCCIMFKGMSGLNVFRLC